MSQAPTPKVRSTVQEDGTIDVDLGSLFAYARAGGPGVWVAGENDAARAEAQQIIDLFSPSTKDSRD